MFKSKRIMVVVAHPDDEILGIGGTIKKLVNKEKCNIKVVILGEGITARDSKRDVEARTEELSSHRSCIEAAKEILGYQELSVHQLPDNRFDSIDLLDIVKIVENEKSTFKPDYIFTHHGGDLNVDHRRTFEAVLTATRPLENECTKGVFCFSTLSSTDWSYALDQRGFRPNLFISLEKSDIESKIQAMKKYTFEARNYPHPRSAEAIEALAKISGANAGTHFGENFEVMRLNLS